MNVPVSNIPWEGFTPSPWSENQAYQYQPYDLPIGPYTNTGYPSDAFLTYDPETEATWVWAYAAMTFILFAIAVAVVRNLYKAHVGKNNIKKQIKKRFRKVFGDDNENVDDSGLINNDPENQYQGPSIGPEEEKQNNESNSDPKGKSSVKDYFKTKVEAVMTKFGKAADYK